MTITYYGQSCFKILSNNLVIITDPFDKSLGLTPPRLNADIVTISHEHFDHNNAAGLGGSPFVIKGPGEYEIKGISVYGIQSFHDEVQGQKRGLNTIYLIEIEGIKICHLGDFGQSKLSEEELEEIDDPDILFVPVGGIYTLDGRQAAAVVNQIEPKIVIPMHYQMSGLDKNLNLAPVDKFLKEMGVAQKEPVEKITFKKKNLPQETEVVVLKI